jgi:alpha-D-ribose 1-methylphosphonate 5-triphosphate diphosphatase
MPDGFVIENAMIVTPDHQFPGWVGISGGRIETIGEGAAPESGIDFDGDLLIPGLIELHTDHLESHLKPRPKVDWPRRAAIVAYDAQLAMAGITTVFDSLRIGNDADYTPQRDEAAGLLNEIEAANNQGLLRVRHHTHLRCEICADDCIENTRAVMESHRVNLISLMDHTPGARQFVSIDAWRTYYGGKSGLAPSQLEQLIERKHDLFARNYRIHRSALVELAHKHNVAIASHDDATADHVGESVEDKVSVAEFPTTVEAARMSHEASIAVLMGAPNVVRGGSHSGNVAAETLAREGVLDILSSDYVPASLLMGAFDLARRIKGYGLPQAIRTVTVNPARAAAITDRGAIANGQRADMVRVRLVDDEPFVREVFRDGHRIV